jgi:long-chain acyl-CoA synthetase
MRPDKTAESFDEEGWFNTGDVVIANPNGSIKIVDRSKNIFKLSQGEYIAPEKVENVFALSKFAEQTMVYGDSLKNCCVGIIVPNPAAVKEWAAENGKYMTFFLDFLNKFIFDVFRQRRQQLQCFAQDGRP